MLCHARSCTRDWQCARAIMQVVEPQLPSNADWREAGHRYLLEDVDDGASDEELSTTQHRKAEADRCGVHVFAHALFGVSVCGRFDSS